MDNMKILPEALELISVGQELNIEIKLLEYEKAQENIDNVLQLFCPFKVNGHIGIGHDSVELPLERWEYSYMKCLPKEEGYIFFGQTSRLSKQTMTKIKDVRLLGEVLEKSYGMEYFLTNRDKDFLISVNWYAIEGIGSVKEYFTKLI